MEGGGERWRVAAAVGGRRNRQLEVAEETMAEEIEGGGVQVEEVERWRAEVEEDGVVADSGGGGWSDDSGGRGGEWRRRQWRRRHMAEGDNGGGDNGRRR